MKYRNVIVIMTGLCLLFGMIQSACAKSVLEEKVDSLFMIASSGGVKFKDMIEPALDSLAGLGGDAVPILIEKFTTKSARERWTIIKAIKKIGAPAVPHLVKALERLDDKIIGRVCLALADVGDSTAVEPLMEICDHKRWNVRSQVVSSLGKIGDARAEDVVLDALEDTIGQVRKSAAVACGRMKIGRSVEKLVHQLGDSFYGARFTACESLRKLDSSTVVLVLEDSLGSSNCLTGYMACQLLGEMGGHDVVDFLFDQTESPDPSRRAVAAEAIIKADPEDECGYRQVMFDNEEDRFVLMKMKSVLDSKASDE